MHGLVNRAIQRFVTDSYGTAQWESAVTRAALDFSEFEAMWIYDDDLTQKVLVAVSEILNRPYEELMEDIGTYLVSHPKVEALRRLLRFGGVSFVEFLHSLDDLPDRARLAVMELELPKMELREHSAEHYTVKCSGLVPGCGYLVMGVLRAMADDYGALAFLEHQGVENGVETISITLLETEFAEGRNFDLGARVG